MHKLFRSSAVLMMAGTLAFMSATTAFAEEGYGPGFNLPDKYESTEQTGDSQAGSAESNTADQTAGTTSAESSGQQNQETTAGQETGGQTADELAAELASAEAAEAAARANLPQLQTTVLIPGSVWSPPFVNDQQIALGDGLGFRSISIFLTNTVGNVLYRTYSSQYGWTPWVMNGQYTTVYADETQMEAIQLKLDGPVSNSFDIYYCSVLSDGTTTGWTKNGEASGTMGTGKKIVGFRMALNGKNVEWPHTTEHVLDSVHDDGVQYIDGQLRYINGDGTNFTGWGYVGSDRYYFVDSYPVTGWQYIDGYKLYFNEAGVLVKDLEPIIGKQNSYQIKINKEMNVTTVYAADGANGYIIPVKSFLCSTGDDTPLGTFKTPEKYRWRLMNSGVYAQYATRLAAGQSFLLHSIIYEKQNNMTLQPSTYNYLGVARSAGCIRFLTQDAKWIFDNCPIGTTITVYNAQDPGPYGRPVIPYTIPDTQTWDPTDVTVTGVN